MRIYQVQRVTAVFLLVFMILHMVMMHYPPREMSFANILDQMQNPYWQAVEILFLFSVVLHALSGAFVVLTDYNQTSIFKKSIAVGFIALGIWAMYWGTTTVLSWG